MDARGTAGRAIRAAAEWRAALAGVRAPAGRGLPRPVSRHWTRRQRWLIVTTAAASALVMVLTGGLSMFVSHLNGNISTQPMAIVGNAPPPSKTGVLNILALGSQTRDGQGPGFGHDPGTDLSDTAMLIHLNAAHTAAIVLSIPRDLLVYRPPCRERVGGNAIVAGQRNAMFDSAMNLGGPACAVATVQAMSGIRIDHFIRVDFNGFRTMTDALGGVQVCVPPPGIHDWRSHLNITAGLHVISGNEALAFVRDRHGIGNGGDLGRIRMQQMFASSLIKKVMSAGTLSDPVTLYRLADDATRSVTTDPGLGSVQALLTLAQSLRPLKLSHITFITLPNELDPADIDRLVPAEPAASGVWRLLRADLPWTGRLPGATLDRRVNRAASPGGASVAVLPGGSAGTGGGKPAARSGAGAGEHAGPNRTAGAASGTWAGQPKPRQAGPASVPAAGVQTRNAGQDLCSGLPTPNNLGELGR